MVAAAIGTHARRADGGYVIDGHKTFIGNAPTADLCIVFATVEPGSRSKGITAFVVEAGDEGFRRGARLPKLGSRCYPAGELHFESCFVGEDRRLGAEGGGFRGLMRVFDWAQENRKAVFVHCGVHPERIAIVPRACVENEVALGLLKAFSIAPARNVAFSLFRRREPLSRRKEAALLKLREMLKA